MKPFERELKREDEGELVQDLQQRLIDLGFNIVYLKDESVGELTAEGYFGEVTESALESFQAKVLDAIVVDEISKVVGFKIKTVADGVMDYGTWYVLENYEKLSEFYKEEIKPDKVETSEEPEPEPDIRDELIFQVVKLAKSQVGVKEHGGNNMGKEVQMYQRIGSNGSFDGGQPYCQFFQNYLLITACLKVDVDYKMSYDGYTPTNVNSGKKRGIAIMNPTINDVEVGDWGYVYSDSRKNAKHVYLIIGKKGNNVITIEGNTNSGGSADGQGVYQRLRPVNHAQCFAVVRWADLY